MKTRYRRLWKTCASGAVLAVAATLAISAAQENLVFFYSPSQVAMHCAPKGSAFRIGGMVEMGSLVRGSDGVTFTVTDYGKKLAVDYRGLLPDLFREGRGVVVLGTLAANGRFAAREVLAKHDENYTAPGTAQALPQPGERYVRDSLVMRRTCR